MQDVVLMGDQPSRGTSLRNQTNGLFTAFLSRHQHATVLTLFIKTLNSCRGLFRTSREHDRPRGLLNGDDEQEP